MDSGLRKQFLLLLKLDLECARLDIPQVMGGPTCFEEIRKRWAPTWAQRMTEKVLGLIEEYPPMPVDVPPMEGGIITCACICHVPIGPGASHEGRPTSCIHCRLIA